MVVKVKPLAFNNGPQKDELLDGLRNDEGLQEGWNEIIILVEKEVATTGIARGKPTRPAWVDQLEKLLGDLGTSKSFGKVEISKGSRILPFVCPSRTISLGSPHEDLIPIG